MFLRLLMSFGRNLALDWGGYALILLVIVVVKHIIIGQILVDILLVPAITILVVKALLLDVYIGSGLLAHHKVIALYLNPNLKCLSKEIEPPLLVLDAGLELWTCTIHRYVTHIINVYFQLKLIFFDLKVSKFPPCKGNSKNDSISFLDVVFPTLCKFFM